MDDEVPGRAVPSAAPAASPQILVWRRCHKPQAMGKRLTSKLYIQFAKTPRTWRARFARPLAAKDVGR